MFSRAAYKAVGGYRDAFYFGQDSDLWMRLAEYGGVAYAGEVYYCYRINPGAISGASRSLQKIFGHLGQACRQARRNGQREEPHLREAAELAEKIRSGTIVKQKSGNRAISYYHIGCLLERRNPAAARVYFRRALALRPLYGKAWVKWLWSGRRSP
jgi:hypothetical protein